MGVLILGLAIFFAIHSVAIVSNDYRNRMVAQMGELAWKGIYASISAVGFALMVWGYGLARETPVVLYVPPQWLSYLAAVLLIPMFPLLIAAYLPSRIGTAAKHPMLAATKLWALAHLLVNGMLADLLLFGSFLAWAVVDRIAVKRRGETGTAAGPRSQTNDVVIVVVGLALYVGFILWFHRWLFGVAPVVW